jgi:hypothetical protein
MPQRHKEARPKRALTSRKQENTQQDLQADHRAGGHKANSWDFHQTVENECQDIMKQSAPTQTKEETTSSLRARDVGGLVILGIFARSTRKRTKMMMVHLDRLLPYQGTARDEQP